ncbi:DUF4932 domain-containing protein [Marinigracilibium pacificum]|uniref:DUF4932 domain-containing protein n=1 Tax=Marinigracilibium pacificum TaxID=2729599 RepID=A0A848J6W4_9BACT|nr:DUF4932 domain-containing protein [Marinigracilibium pacificum]NMM50129.1 DUF4932 domain-containing protein [Marinigracilibium pacificum]
MKPLLQIIIFIFCSLSSIAQEKNITNPKLKIHFEKNVEFIGFIYFIGFETEGIEDKTININGKEIPKKEWHNYGYSFYKKYHSKFNSEHLQKAISVANHLWLDKILNLLIRVQDFPNADIPSDLPLQFYIDFSIDKDSVSAYQNASIFLSELNEFYEEINFDQYLNECDFFYQKAITEIEQTKPKYDFISSLENYFSNEYNSYHLIPSLTLPKTMGFGLKYPDGGICNVFGALDFQVISNPDSLNMGFKNEIKLRELSIHEFGHSFIHKAWASIPDSLINATSHLMTPIKEQMYDQGYNNWNTVINEHIIRTVELIIAKNNTTINEYNVLRKDYLEKRQFIYIPIFEKILINYKKNYSGFEEAVIDSIMILYKDNL